MMQARLSNRTGLFATIHVIWMFTSLSVVSHTLAHTPHDVIRVLEISPIYQTDQTLFVIVLDRVLKSTDSGVSWKQLSHGLDNKHSFSSMAISPSFASDRTLFLSSEGDGVYKSIDGGLSWHRVTTTMAHLDIGLITISPDYSADNTLYAAGTEGGLYRTTDGGGMWHQVLGNGVKITALAFSPMKDDKHIFIGDEKGGVYASTDSGDTWVQQFRLLKTDSITSLAISPHFSSDATIFVGTQKSGVVKYNATSGSYVVINNGL